MRLIHLLQEGRPLSFGLAPPRGRREVGMVTRRDLCAGALAAAGGSSLSAGAPKPREHRYLHYDVFTDRPLTGNQLAVFTDPAGLTADDMARITREMNFSECTFV